MISCQSVRLVVIGLRVAACFFKKQYVAFLYFVADQMATI